MLRMSATMKDETAKLRKPVKQYNIEGLTHAAGIVRKTAQQSIRKRTGVNYSAPGKPPKTRDGLLKKSIIYIVDKQAEEAVIGPTANVIGDIGALHEFGGVRTFKRKGKRVTGRYPARPFMGPAFEKILPRLPESWRRKIQPGSG